MNFGHFLGETRYFQSISGKRGVGKDMQLFKVKSLNKLPDVLALQPFEFGHVIWMNAQRDSF